MANSKLFSTKTGSKILPIVDAVNEAGGIAYQLSDESALAQYAVTGCLNGTFYASADMQLATVLELASKVPSKFLAQVAVYAREEGLMKDMPALLLAILSTRDIELTKAAFPRVCDDAKMVKNFVQIIRSGQVGRQSLGTALKRLVQNWLATRTEEQLFKAVVGNDPSLADIIRMVHPKPKNRARGAFYKYLIGKELTGPQEKLLPENVRAYEKFKARGIVGKVLNKEVPDVPFLLLANLKLDKDQFKQVAERMSWSALRQNLNSLSKHDIFEANTTFTREIAKKLADPGQVRKSNAFPFQLFSAYKATEQNPKVPKEIANALQDAMEASLSNVPELDGKTYVAVDISGSMGSPATGDRGSATSTVSCLDAAAVMGSALLRRNPNNVEIIPFSDDVVLTDARPAYMFSYSVAGGARTPQGNKVAFNGRDSVMTNVEKLRALPSGGTNCSSVLKHLNAIGTKGASAVIYVSDNESWMDSSPSYYGRGSRATETMNEWNKFRKNNPNAKLVCIDIQPSKTTQAAGRPEILNVGGFSDSVFTVVDLFLKNDLTGGSWIGKIKETKL